MKHLPLVCLLLNFFSCGQLYAQSLQSSNLSEVSLAPYQEKIHRTGKLAFKRTTILSFKSSGYLTELTVDEGEYFKKDQLLARLDVAELVADKNVKYAQLIKAKREVTRLTKLMQQKLSSQQQLDDAKTLVETSRARYKVAFYNLQKAQISAPFAGIVLKRFTELGELQAPGKSVLQVAALKNNWVVKVALTGQEVSQVRLQQKVKVRLSNQNVVDGVVSKIPAIANGSNNLFTIEVLLPKLTKQAGVIAGQLADVIITTFDKSLVYKVPIAALVAVNEQGKAIIVTQQPDDKKLHQQLFDIYKLDNRFVYLLANENSQPLQLLTQGWQNITLAEQNTSLLQQQGK